MRKLPHLQREVTRHGRVNWYVRIDRGKRIRIHGDYGSPDFMEAYYAALVGERTRGTPADPRSLQWLFDQWRQSSDWANTASSTRKQRENILSRVIAENPSAPFAAITAEHIRAGRERRKDTPYAARNFQKTMRALFRWAEEAGHVQHNPAAEVALLTPKTDGFRPWSLGDLHKFRNRWPLGTRERTALEVLAGTGLRRGDAVRLGPQHLSGGVFTITLEKTGATIYLPVLPDLADAIDAIEPAETYITGANGKPMVKESFGNWFRDVCKATGIDGAAHGVRKLAATIFAEHGATEQELRAWFGWSTNDQSALYTRSASKKRLAQQAAEKLSRNP